MKFVNDEVIKTYQNLFLKDIFFILYERVLPSNMDACEKCGFIVCDYIGAQSL